MIIKKYFTRPDPPPGMRIRPYDYEVLRILDDYRFLDSRTLWRITRLSYPDLTWDTFKHRLFKLWANGFMARPEEQTVHWIKSDDYHLIHCLTVQGARTVAEHFHRDFQQSTWRVNQERTNFRFLGHQLQISRFRAAIELSGAFDLLFWRHDRQYSHRVAFTPNTPAQKSLFSPRDLTREGIAAKNVEPDSLFCGRHEQGTAVCSLEIDNGTASNVKASQKYLYYYKLLHSLPQNPAKVDGYTIPHFWVLTVSPDETSAEHGRAGLRMKHLQEGVRAIAEGDHGPQFEGYRSFLFSTQDRFSLDDPSSILQEIWETPNSESRSLLTLPQYVDQNGTQSYSQTR